MRFLAILLLLGIPKPQPRAAASEFLGDIVITTPERTYTAKSLEIKQVMGEPHVEFEDATKKTHVLKCVDVVDISIAPLAAPKAAGPGDVVIALTTGDTLVGALGDNDKEGVHLASSTLGETTIKFEQIEAIRFAAHRSLWPTYPRPAELNVDRIVTRTGDERDGTLVTAGKDGVVYKSRVLRGREVTVKPGECVLVHAFLLEKPPAAPKGVYAIIQLTDGTEIRGTLDSMAGGVLKFTDLYGTARQVGAASIAGFYFKNGRVIYLSDMAVASHNENANFIRDPKKNHDSDLREQHRLDRNVKGGPLKIGGQEFRKGIGAHSRSELSFDLDKQFQKFEASVGIDDFSRQLANPCGSVVFRILGDGKKLWESPEVTWKDAKPLPVSVLVKDVKTLTLVVDWGEDAASGDNADWAAARVIR